jgi:hypothetical protein
MAVQRFEWFHHKSFGHHMVIKAVNEERTAEEFPDGSVWDCLSQSFYEESDLGPQAALFNANVSAGNSAASRGVMQLLSDQAVLVPAGTRYMIQSHYINVTDRDLHLQDILHFGLVPLEDVERPVGTWTFTSSDFSIPPGLTQGVGHTCGFPRDVFVSMLMVHMHGFATHFDSVLSGGIQDGDEFYNVDEWRDEWRYFYPNTSVEPGYPVPVESKLTYTCHFENSTDHSLEWPEEMCVFEGLAYPLYRPFICNLGRDESGDVVPEFDYGE